MRCRSNLRICFESAIGSHSHYWEIAKDLMKACRLPSSVGFAARYPRAKPTPVSYPLVKGGPMNRLLFTVILSATVGIVALQAQGQNPPPTQPPKANADPYANNPDAGVLKFPLAAPAGKDSGAMRIAPPGAVNKEIPDEATWKFGSNTNPPPGAQIWNPVMAKMKAGGKVTGGTVFSATDPTTYCAMANAGYDFIWTEMQHSTHDWDQVSKMWSHCPHAKAVPGARVAFAN